MTVSDDHGAVLIDNFPPNASLDQVGRDLAALGGMRPWTEVSPDLHQYARLPLKEIRDESTDARGDLIVCVPTPRTTPEQLRDQITSIYGVYTTVPAALPRPLPTLIRNWAKAHAAEDLQASLAALQDAIGTQRPRR